MGLYEEQLEKRAEHDKKMIGESMVSAVGAVLGEQAAVRIRDDRMITKQAFDDLLKYYHFQPVEIPNNITDYSSQLDYCLNIYGIMKRQIFLSENWWNESYGPVLVYTKEKHIPVTLLPNRIKGYYYIDRETGKKTRLNKQTDALYEREAYCFYKPFPHKKMGIHELLKYMKSCLTHEDGFFMIILTLLSTVMGMMIPISTKALTGSVAMTGDLKMLLGITVFIFGTAISSQLINSTVRILTARTRTKITISVQAAMMMRILSLPTNFFRKGSAGELSAQSTAVDKLCDAFVDLFAISGLTSLASLLYFVQIFSFTPVLVLPALIAILTTVLISIMFSVVQTDVSRQYMEKSAKESGLGYSMLNGIQKIKLIGAEKRFFARWLKLYAESMELVYSPPLLVKTNKVITLAISTVFNVIMCYFAARNGIEQASYLAFAAAYGALTGGIATLTVLAPKIGSIKPIYEMVEPFLTTEPEIAENKEYVANISGSIELNHIHFRYDEDSPYILNDLSLKIKAGEYVAIVGRTGCGKSTLIRLLLGFDKPEKGTIFYDKRDISRIDIHFLRRQIGAVTQNGGVFGGDIYSNIVISAPQLTVDEAWRVAERSGIAEEIKAMPMGMYTQISENHSSISGGQKQRIMLARALAANPKILLLDEATSALDNLTQKHIIETLSTLKCTRIVVAHRLSTICNCDRILVLDGGKIIEDGTYHELIEKGGFFANLISNQVLDSGD